LKKKKDIDTQRSMMIELNRKDCSRLLEIALMCRWYRC